MFYVGSAFCFREKIVNYHHLFNEIFTTFLHFSALVGSLDLNRHYLSLNEKVAKYMITALWSSNCFFTALKLFLKLKNYLFKKKLPPIIVPTDTTPKEVMMSWFSQESKPN